MFHVKCLFSDKSNLRMFSCMYESFKKKNTFYFINVSQHWNQLSCFSLWPTEDLSRWAANQLCPPGPVLPRRQVLPTPGDCEETLRPSAYPAAQTYSVRERERQRKRRELDGWRSDQETQRDEDGTVKNSLFRIMKVQPGPLLWLKFRGLFMVWISASDLFFFFMYRNLLTFI